MYEKELNKQIAKLVDLGFLQYEYNKDGKQRIAFSDYFRNLK